MDEQTRFENQQRRLTVAVAWGCGGATAILLSALAVAALATLAHLAHLD